MSANEQIGDVETMYLMTQDVFQNKIKTNISKGFIVNPEATYEQVDTATRALNSLTRNTYEDTILITSISVTEKIME